MVSRILNLLKFNNHFQQMKKHVKIKFVSSIYIIIFLTSQYSFMKDPWNFVVYLNEGLLLYFSFLTDHDGTNKGPSQGLGKANWERF